MRIEKAKLKLIACMCEGGAETAIMDILLDNDLLIFNREQLIDETVIPRTSVRTFEKNYLRREYDNKVLVLRVIDSRNEQFNLSKAYRHQVVDVINVITAPEIEMLIIVSENKHKEFCNSEIKKPSVYCKSILKLKDVKSPEFIKEYFSDVKRLVDSIIEYHRVHEQKHNEASIYDLLKNKNRRGKT
ncbi:hypothetical protein [Abiotrophia defectiva]|jgi:hypothetical protein|uniref:hypothetical protein n=1 Tax=Abiotrophia defectiva TaxID=46125 RepID=UPI0026F24DDE|nr:hypothetical protein [Abiotrophia defectiva]